MTGSEIDDEINVLRDAIANDDESAAQHAALKLFADFLKNVRRVADALEELSL